MQTRRGRGRVRILRFFFRDERLCAVMSREYSASSLRYLRPFSISSFTRATRPSGSSPGPEGRSDTRFHASGGQQFTKI